MTAVAHVTLEGRTLVVSVEGRGWYPHDHAEGVRLELGARAKVRSESGRATCVLLRATAEDLATATRTLAAEGVRVVR